MVRLRCVYGVWWLGRSGCRARGSSWWDGELAWGVVSQCGVDAGPLGVGSWVVVGG